MFTFDSIRQHRRELLSLPFGCWLFAIQPALAENSLTPASQTPAAATSLTLNQAIQLAIQTHPSQNLARLEIEAQDALLDQSRRRPNPELEYQQEDTRSDSTSRSLQLNFPVELGGKRAARIATAEADLTLAEQDRQLQQLELSRQVMASFLDCLQTEERLNLARQRQQLARQAADMAAKRVTAGQLSPVEASKAELATTQARLELSQAESSRRRALQQLSQWIGPITGPVRLAPLPPPSPLPALTQLQQQISHSPLLERAELDIQRQQRQVQLERSKQQPDLRLSLGVKRANELERDQLLLGLSMPLPWSDRNQGNLQHAISRATQAELRRQAQQLELQTELLQAYEQRQSADTELQLLNQQLLPAAQLAYERSLLGFEHGKFSMLEVLDAQRSLLEARSSQTQSLLAAQRATLTLNLLLGFKPQPE